MSEITIAGTWIAAIASATQRAWAHSSLGHAIRSARGRMSLQSLAIVAATAALTHGGIVWMSPQYARPAYGAGGALVVAALWLIAAVLATPITAAWRASRTRELLPRR